MFIEFQGKHPKIAATAFVAPTAVVIGDVEVGEESSIWFGVVIRGDNGRSGSAPGRASRTIRSSTSATTPRPSWATTARSVTA